MMLRLDGRSRAAREAALDAATPATPSSARADAAPRPPPPPTPARAGALDPAFLANVASSTARAKLDAFRDRCAGPFLVDGQEVRARPMFRMNTGYNQASANAHAGELRAIGARARLAAGDVALARIGRASPEQLVRVTQALIDAGKLPPPPGATETRIRRMQWTWGIGMDCAGYTAHAAIAVHGRAAAALRNDMTDPFSAMAHGRLPFRKVAVDDVRPGDVIHLDAATRGDVGHIVIVADRHLATDGERGALAASSPEAAAFVAAAGPLHVLAVDSSWGAGDGEDYGGYRRDTWLYDEGTKQWASFDRETHALVASPTGPCGERFAGAFRPKGAP